MRIVRVKFKHLVSGWDWRSMSSVAAHPLCNVRAVIINSSTRNGMIRTIKHLPVQYTFAQDATMQAIACAHADAVAGEDSAAGRLQPPPVREPATTARHASMPRAATPSALTLNRLLIKQTELLSRRDNDTISVRDNLPE
ncbi:hypothetical protein RR46_11900 [Papilio xuthus]|uniref:Uncharacterized protein n=1 Tax=Papilio xuthus TaxID=66420 RepID=A0A194PN86_PAPXU|nr:hypothetical protein RR46_11900 [Papilio xuthus]